MGEELFSFNSLAQFWAKETSKGIVVLTQIVVLTTNA